MLGYADMREVMIWAQTKEAARVRIQYWEQGKTGPKLTTPEVRTQAETAYTARFLADRLQPGKRYQYEVIVNDKPVALAYPLSFQTQTLWQWRTDPPAFTFAIGSCTYINEEPYDRPGTPYGGGAEIFKAIQAKKPNFMVWTGDNTYLREIDWNTRNGVLHRYTHTRSVRELQPLLASTHHYAIWDDHDFGPNDADRGYWLKPVTREAFRMFWGNPNYIFEDAVTGTFTWNDCQFFLLDDRSFKTPNHLQTGDRTLLGQKQFDWLIDALSYSQATFKFVVIGGQVINPAAIFENYATYGEERDRLIKAITDGKIPGVLFITGDRHHSIMHKLDRPGTYPLYDLTISPLTSGPAKAQDQELALPTVVPNTYLSERNFATLEVSGPQKERTLTIRAFDAKGAERWTQVLRAADLR